MYELVDCGSAGGGEVHSTLQGAVYRGSGRVVSEASGFGGAW